MPKVKADGTTETANTVYRHLKNAGYVCKDIHPGNVGHWKGRAVIFDYGFDSGLHCRRRGLHPGEMPWENYKPWSGPDG